MIENQNPLNENNRYAKLVSNGSGKELGLINSGYGGIAVSKANATISASMRGARTVLTGDS